MRRFISLVSVVGAAVSIGAMALAGGATGAGGLPTLGVALTGANGISVSGSAVSGAVNIVTTFSGSVPRGSNGPSFVLARLNPGATAAQAFGAVQAAHGDINAVSPYAALLVSGSPGTTQAVLTPGSWLALNTTGNGQPAVEQFTVTESPSPAVLPGARATETAIEFGFRGPTVLHRGTILREVNRGWLVHMNLFIGVKSKAAGKLAMAFLRAGRDNKAGRYFTNGAFGTGPVSHGALQQQVVTARPGYYVEVCFMDTQDGREHTQVGMERLVRVVR